jgi:cellulose synthase/poly-beta-1,6-N-acetylglucosamine synthase-like glycosyltransferase
MLYFSILGIIFLVVIGLEVGYLYLLALASLLPQTPIKDTDRWLRFAVAIPAYNEADVIADTVRRIKDAKYPQELLDIYVVADHCIDTTAINARDAGATVFERQTEEKGGKGAALAWLFERIFHTCMGYDAIAVFDSDTLVDPDYFRIMNQRMGAGSQAVQGKHVISNPEAGWFPALTWAMFMIDNRFQNQGRARLGLSAKNMGDSICFQGKLIQRYGWCEGLTEDYAFRQRLLMEGICIDYEPRAIGNGEAAPNWDVARVQRSRWILGAYLANRNTARNLLIEGFKRGNAPLLDGALQAYLPSYSTLTILTGILTGLAWIFQVVLVHWLPMAFTGLFITIFFFPILNLAMELAPPKAYLMILTGPIYIFWRTWISIVARLSNKKDQWVRTPHTKIRK